MLACTALVGCTNEDVVNEQENGKDQLEQSYISVKLVSPSTRSRAFEDGNDAEQIVSRARFYLFNADGSAYTINDVTDNTNYVDVTQNDLKPEYQTGANNVETICEAVLVIDKSKATPPSSIVAVLNYPLNENGQCVWGNGQMSLNQLKDADVAYNHGTIKASNTIQTQYNTSGNFVMTNSVYVDEGTNRTVIEATPISANNIKASANEAKNAPVKIYVERISAKVQVSMGSTFTKGTDGYYTISTGLVDANNKDITAKILGWRVTNITEKSYLIKNLTNNYTSFNSHTGAATNWSWNDESNFRSYWANTTELSTPTHPWNFNEVSNGFDDTDNVDNWEYYNENTHASTHSQLLVVAQFIVDGTATPIAEWYGTKYTYKGLQEVVANFLAKKIYTRTGSEGNYIYTSIQPTAIKFEQVPDSENSDRYLSKAVVEWAADTYYDENQNVYASKDALNTVLATVRPAKIWGNMNAENEYEGGGYYYVDIVQNAGDIARDTEGNVTSDTNVYGLVRNHWYKITLNNLNGLGTPVYNPDMIIKTEKPDTDESFIAAEINVLAWNIKSQTVILE